MEENGIITDLKGANAPINSTKLGKKDIEMILIVLFIIVFLVMSIYSLGLENKYNTMVTKYNDCMAELANSLPLDNDIYKTNKVMIDAGYIPTD